MKRVTITYVQPESGYVKPTVLESEDMPAGCFIHTDEKGNNPVGYRVYAGHETVYVPFGAVQAVRLELDAKPAEAFAG